MRTKRRLKVWMLVAAAFGWAVVTGAIQGSHDGGDIAWAEGMSAGTAQAQQSQKPTMLSFHTPGCGFCHKLDAETFSDPKVIELARNFVCVRLDSEMDGAEMRQYNVHDFPTTIFIDPQGRETARFSGYVAPQNFAAVLTLLLKQNNALHAAR